MQPQLTTTTTTPPTTTTTTTSTTTTTTTTTSTTTTTTTTTSTTTTTTTTTTATEPGYGRCGSRSSDVRYWASAANLYPARHCDCGRRAGLRSHVACAYGLGFRVVCFQLRLHMYEYSGGFSVQGYV